MDQKSIQAETVNLMNQVPRALVACARSHRDNSLEPFSLRRAAAEYAADKEGEADTVILIANLMSHLKIESISFAVLKEFTESFINWLATGDMNEVERHYQPVSVEAKKATALEKAYQDVLKRACAVDKNEYPLTGVFLRASVLYQTALMIDAAPQEDQLRLRSALCTLIAPPKRRVALDS
jgi:hypothetical protein